MRALIVDVVSVLGRYGVLLLVPPVAALTWLSTLLIDTRPVLGLIVFFPVLMIAIATLVLIMGMLLSALPRPSGIVLSRQEAPEIWDYWEKSSPPARGMRRQVLVDDQINAAMGERHRIAGLLGRDQTLVVGLGLMIILDRPSLEAVLEHEFAHGELNHSRGLTRLAEFVNTYGAFEDQIEETMPMVAVILELAFRCFDFIVGPEHLRRSRQNEFEADRQSAERVGAAVEANTQMVIEGAAKLAEARIYEPLERELFGATAAPEPPLNRLLEMREELVDPASLRKAVDEIIAQEDDPQSTHPSLAQRLSAIGARPDAEILQMGPPAYRSVMSESAWQGLVKKINDQWIEAVNEMVSLD